MLPQKSLYSFNSCWFLKISGESKMGKSEINQETAKASHDKLILCFIWIRHVTFERGCHKHKNNRWITVQGMRWQHTGINGHTSAHFNMKPVELGWWWEKEKVIQEHTFLVLPFHFLAEIPLSGKSFRAAPHIQGSNGRHKNKSTCVNLSVGNISADTYWSWDDRSL